MARLDLGGLRDLWYRIDDIFARLTEAGGSFTWSSPSLTLNSVAGGTLSTVNLGDGLATDDEAAHSITGDSTAHTITLKSVTGTVLGSAVNIATVLNNYFGRKLSWNASTGKLALQGNNGTELDSVTISVPSTSGLISLATADDRYFASLRADGNTVYFLSHDGTTLGTLVIN